MRTLTTTLMVMLNLSLFANNFVFHQFVRFFRYPSRVRHLRAGLFRGVLAIANSNAHADTNATQTDQGLSSDSIGFFSHRAKSFKEVYISQGASLLFE